MTKVKDLRNFFKKVMKECNQKSDDKVPPFSYPTLIPLIFETFCFLMH